VKLGRSVAAGTLPIVAIAGAGAVPLEAASVFALLRKGACCDSLTDSAGANPVPPVPELPVCVLPGIEASATPLARVEVAGDASRAASVSAGLEKF
jgi:hypothetical protein